VGVLFACMLGFTSRTCTSGNQHSFVLGDEPVGQARGRPNAATQQALDT
jgi:hypothetical protein